ncbi:hypothetical protein JCM9279_004015 [Rhodotorula babjevae]
MPSLVVIGCSSGLGLGALSQWCRRLVSLSPPRPTRWLVLAGQRSPLDSPPSAEQRNLAALCTANPDTLRLEWLALDLADSDSLRAFAHQVHARTDSVDALVLNAAVWTADDDPASVAVDGRVWTQEAVVNALAQHLLIDLLEPLLVATKAASSSARSRIIVTTSKLHSIVTSIDDLVDQLHPPSAPAASATSTSTSRSANSSTGKSRYAASKALQLVSAAYWATRLADKGVDVVAVSPGFVPTTALSRAQSPVARWAMRHLVSWLPFAVSADEGAARIARCLPLGAEPHSTSAVPTSSSTGGAPSSSPLGAAPPAASQDELLPLFDAMRTASATSAPSARLSAAPPPLLYLTGSSTSPLPPPLFLPHPRASPSSPSISPRAVSQPAATPEGALELASAAHEPPGEFTLDVGGGVAQLLIERACGSAALAGGGGDGEGGERAEDEGAVRALLGWEEVGRAVLGRSGVASGEGDRESWGALKGWEWGARASSRAGASEEEERPRDELGVD